MKARMYRFGAEVSEGNNLYQAYQPKHRQLINSYMDRHFVSYKKNCALLLVFLAVSGSFLYLSAESTSSSSYFILPGDDDTITLNSYTEGRIVEIERHKLTSNSLYDTDGEKHLAIFEVDRLNLIVHNIEDGTFIKTGTPFQITAKAVLVHDNVVYIGGFQEGTLVISYSILEKKWETLAVPSEPVHLNRKAIDALLTDGETLYAVDNIVFPKYMLYYKIKESRAEYSHFEELKGTSDIKYAKMSAIYIAIFSISSRRPGPSNSITVYKKDNLSKFFYLTGSFRSFGDDQEINRFDDFVVVGEKLIVINRSKGLGILEIEDDFFGNRKNYQERVNYDKLKTGAGSGERITALKVIPGTGKVVLIVRGDDGRNRYEILEP